jgi:hypothetical protein
MDRFFTAYDLLADLRILGFRAAGTVREMRLKRCPLEEMNESDKYERGSYDYECDRKVLAVKWKDIKNACLTLNYEFALSKGPN